MVSNLEIQPILEFVIEINKIRTRVMPAKKFISQGVVVKGKKGILESLKRIYPRIKDVAEKRMEFSGISHEVDNYIAKMEKRYGETTGMNPLKLAVISMSDAKNLVESIDDWIKQIFQTYSKSPTKLIKIEELRKIVNTLSEIVDEQSRKDLEDAYDCMINNLPTPAIMILYRIGESKVKELYKKEMKIKSLSNSSTMGSMAIDLRKKQEAEIKAGIRNRVDPLIHYIIAQTEERNLVQHPIKRYEPEEAEEAFIFVKKMIMGIHKML